MMAVVMKYFNVILLALTFRYWVRIISTNAAVDMRFILGP